MLLIPWIRRNVHGHLKKSATLNWRTLLSVISLAAFAATEFDEIFGQTGCKSSPTFQWLTPSPSSGCCWRLGKTQTDEQVPYCAVCRPPFGLGARTVGHLFVGFGFTVPWTVPETLDNFHTFSRLSARDFIVNVTYNRWPHLPSKG